MSMRRFPTGIPVKLQYPPVNTLSGWGRNSSSIEADLITGMSRRSECLCLCFLFPSLLDCVIRYDVLVVGRGGHRRVLDGQQVPIAWYRRHFESQ